MFKEISVILVIALAVGIFSRGVNILSNTFFSPKERALERTVFKESEQYNDSMIRDLAESQTEYIKANEEQKAALRAVILHKFSVYDETKLPSSLRSFYTELRGY